MKETSQTDKKIDHVKVAKLIKKIEVYLSKQKETKK